MADGKLFVGSSFTRIATNFPLKTNSVHYHRPLLHCCCRYSRCCCCKLCYYKILLLSVIHLMYSCPLSSSDVGREDSVSILAVRSKIQCATPDGFIVYFVNWWVVCINHSDTKVITSVFKFFSSVISSVTSLVWSCSRRYRKKSAQQVECLYSLLSSLRQQLIRRGCHILR